MILPGSIILVEYDSGSRRLTVSFDSQCKLVFYDVQSNVAALLADASVPDEAFAVHVFGHFAWTEIGALPEWELERSASQGQARGAA